MKSGFTLIVLIVTASLAPLPCKADKLAVDDFEMIRNQFKEQVEISENRRLNDSVIDYLDHFLRTHPHLTIQELSAEDERLGQESISDKSYVLQREERLIEDTIFQIDADRKNGIAE